MKFKVSKGNKNFLKTEAKILIDDKYSQYNRLISYKQDKKYVKEKK